jgi:hypothetical protein
MKDVMIKFNEFIAVFEYLIERLKKHAIIKENGDYKDISFLLFAAEIKQPQEVIEEVLNFFSGNDGRYKYKQNDVVTKYTQEEIRVLINPIQFFNHYNQNPDEIIIQIKDYKDTKTDFLLQFFDNIRLIAQEENKRKLFEKFIVKIKELQTQGLLHNTLVPEFRDSKLTFIFHEYTGLESEFDQELWQFVKNICNEIRLLPTLKNNDDKYDISCDEKLDRMQILKTNSQYHNEKREAAKERHKDTNEVKEFIKRMFFVIKNELPNAKISKIIKEIEDELRLSFRQHQEKKVESTKVLKHLSTKYKFSDTNKIASAIDYWNNSNGGQIEAWCYQFAKKPAEGKTE